MSTKARIKANNKYNAKAYEIITFRAKKSLQLNKLLDVAAQKTGKSKAQYIYDAIIKQLSYDNITIEDLDQIIQPNENISNEIEKE